MASHSSVLAWRIPWTAEPGGLQSKGLQTKSWTQMIMHVCMRTHTHTQRETQRLTDGRREADTGERMASDPRQHSGTVPDPPQREARRKKQLSQGRGRQPWARAPAGRGALGLAEPRGVPKTSWQPRSQRCPSAWLPKARPRPAQRPEGECVRVCVWVCQWARVWAGRLGSGGIPRTEGEGCGAGGLHIMWGPSIPDGHLVSCNPNAEWPSGLVEATQVCVGSRGPGHPPAEGLWPWRSTSRHVATRHARWLAGWLAGWTKALLARRQATAWGRSRHICFHSDGVPHPNVTWVMIGESLRDNPSLLFNGSLLLQNLSLESEGT